MLSAGRYIDSKFRVSPCGSFCVLHGGLRMAVYDKYVGRSIHARSIGIVRRTSTDSASYESDEFRTIKVSDHAKMAFDCYSRLYVVAASDDAMILSMVHYDESWKISLDYVSDYYMSTKSRYYDSNLGKILQRKEPYDIAAEAISRDEVYLIVFFERISSYRFNIS